MKTELIDLSQTRKEIKISIDADDVRSQYDRVSDRFARQATVPGFRPGRAPREVVRRHYKNEIRGEVLRELLPQAVAGALDEYGLNPLFEPDIQLENTEGLEQLGQQPLSIQASVEVLPSVELGEYKGLELTRYVRPITDELVDQTIERIRRQSASLQPVEDRGAELGDTVTADFHGKPANGEEGQEEIDVEDTDVVLGSEQVLPEMTENLLGVKPDEERRFRVTYPDDFDPQELAGQAIDYLARVTAVRYTEMPEMDDEWVQSVDDEAKSVEEYRRLVRQRLEVGGRMESEGRLRDDLMSQLIEMHQFEMPETLINQQAQALLRSTLYEMMERGIDPRRAGLQLEPLRNAMRQRADRELRGSFLLEQIARDAQIEVSAEDEAAEVERMAEAYQQTPEQVRAALTKEGGERSIADGLRVRRTLDFLVENARIADGEWREEEEDGVAADGEEATATQEEVAAEHSSESAASEDEPQA